MDPRVLLHTGGEPYVEAAGLIQTVEGGFPLSTVGTTRSAVTVAMTVTIPTPGIIAARTVTPAVITVIVTVPTPTVGAATKVLPAVIARSFTVPTPTVLVAAARTPAVVVTVVTVPTPLISVTGAAQIVTPAVIARSFTVPTPTVTVTGAAQTATPAVIARVFTVPTPDVSGLGSVEPAVIDLIFDVPTPDVTPGEASTVFPLTVELTFDIPTPTVNVSEVAVTPAVVAGVFTIPTPTVLIGGTVMTPAVVPIVVTIPTPTAGPGAVANPATVVCRFTVPTPSSFGVGSEGRMARMVVIVGLSDIPADARMAREAIVVAHHYPEVVTDGQVARMSITVAISRPHGWDVFEDPASQVIGLSDDDQGGPIVGGPDDVTAPAVPSGLDADPGDTFISLTWNDNPETDLASYKIYRSLAAGGPFALHMTVVDESQTLDSGLTNGTEYWYTISAVDETGNESAQSSAVSTIPVVPPVATPPPVPLNLQMVVAGDKHVDLQWTSGGFASDFSHYNVYRATVTGGPYTLFTTRTVTSASVTGLTNGSPYFFVVTAEDVDGNESANSNQVTGTPVAVVVVDPTLPTPNVIFDSANLYAPNKVTDEPAGTVFQFKTTGGNSSGPRYENAAIPRTGGSRYRFDAGTVLDGNLSTVLAFTGTATGITIYDCEWTAYQGQNSSGLNNTKGAAAIRLRGNDTMYRPDGHHNKYSAVSFDGSGAQVIDGRLYYNGEFGFKGGGGTTGCEINGTEVDHNGGAQGLDLGGDQGGCKVVHSNGFRFIDVNAHDNYGNAGASGIGTQGGNGLWTDINNINTVFDGCTLTNNAGAGIFHEVSLSFEIKNCTFTNNGRDYNATSGGLWPVSSQIQISNSGGTLGWIHDNVINISSGAIGFYGITLFNSTHFQWTNGVISNGCLGTRNLLIENNTLNISGSQWKAAIAITGNLPTSRSADQFCNQQPITATASNNRIRNNTVLLSGGVYPNTPYIRAGVRVSANAWTAFGYT